MRILTLETTCDETAAAVVDDALNVLGSAVASQDDLHEKFGGVVPEIASRAHVERILPVIDQALSRANTRLEDLQGIGIATTPGLAGSLLVGLVAAKTLALVHDLPLVAINHLQAHIYACRFAGEEDIFPCIGLVVSGGHSSLFRCRSALEFEAVGGTIDDAAGEAFDKVASMLGLPYPGGPAIERAARSGDPAKFRLPRPLSDDESRLDFSFSGLKTSVRYSIGSPGGPPVDARQLDSQLVADMSASFQQAVVDCLVGKAMLAVQRFGATTLCVGGGVAANSYFRMQLERAAEQRGCRLVISPRELCTDNAVMGAIAIERLKAGLTETLVLDIQPGLVRMPTRK